MGYGRRKQANSTRVSDCVRNVSGLFLRLISSSSARPEGFDPSDEAKIALDSVFCQAIVSESVFQAQAPEFGADGVIVWLAERGAERAAKSRMRQKTGALCLAASGRRPLRGRP